MKLIHHKSLLILFFLLLSAGLFAKGNGFGFYGGIGWGGGVYQALPGLQAGTYYADKEPRSDSAYSHNYGMNIFYTPLPDDLENLSFVFGLSKELKRMRVAYAYNGTSAEGWQQFMEYTLKASYTTFAFGLRVSTLQEYLFTGKIFLGGGVFYSLAPDTMEINLTRMDRNEGWYSQLMLFDVMNITKRSLLSNDYSNSGIKDDKGIYFEIGLYYPLNDDNDIFFTFFAKYSVGLTTIYEPDANSPLIQRTVSGWATRSFILNISFDFKVF